MSLTCPVCGSHLDRVHCRPLDRLIGLVVPVRRYRCHNSRCSWEERRLTPHAKRTNSRRDLKFRLAIVIIGLGTFIGTSFMVSVITKSPQLPVLEVKGVPKIPIKILRELGKK